jgi:O-antigen/teichoic acid export membrane protein
VSTANAVPQRIARNALVRSGGEIVAKVASLLFFVTMARELGREGFGAFMFALGLTGTLLFAAGFGTDELTARDTARDRSRAARYLADVGALKAVSTTVLLGVAIIVVNLGDFSADSRAAVVIVGVGVAVETIARTWYAIFQAHERLELISLSLVLQRTATAAVGIAVLKAGGGVVASAVIYTGGALLGLALSELSVRRLVGRRPRPEPRHWPGLVRTSFPIGVAAVLFILLMRLDVTVLSFIAGEAEVGIYAAAYRLVESTQFIAWAITGATMPWLSRATSTEGDRGLARGYELGLKGMNGVLMPISLVFVLYAKPLIEVLYGPAFAPAVLPLQLLGLTGALYGMQSYASSTLIARDSPTVFARLVAVVVVINLAGNALAIPSYGADGAAAVSLGSTAILAAASVWLASRRIGGVQVARSFAGPLAGAGAMTLVALILPGPWVVALAVALVAYLAGLIATERLFFREDFGIFVGLLPNRVTAWSASRSRSGRGSA